MTDPGSNPNRNEHLIGYMFHDAIIVTVNDRDAQRIHARAVEIFATFDDTPSTFKGGDARERPHPRSRQLLRVLRRVPRRVQGRLEYVRRG